MERIPINSIRPRDGARLRALRPERVKALAESIAEIGLQTPITVVVEDAQLSSMNHNGKVYQLITGEHRFEACKELGWSEIPAIFLALGDIQRELWYIDENLCRADLNELERAEHLRQRKWLYEQIHPQTKHGGDHGNQHTGGKKRQEPDSGSCQTTQCFVDDTATKTGMSKSAIKQSIHRAETIVPEVMDTILDMPAIADTGVELDALASLPAAQQKEAVAMVKSGAAKNVRQAKEAIAPKPKPKPVATPAPTATPAPEPAPVAVSPATKPEPHASKPEPPAPKPEPPVPPVQAKPEPETEPVIPAPRPDVAKRVARVWDLAGKIQQCEVTSDELRKHTPDLSVRLLLLNIGKLLSGAGAP